MAGRVPPRRAEESQLALVRRHAVARVPGRRFLVVLLETDALALVQHEAPVRVARAFVVLRVLAVHLDPVRVAEVGTALRIKLQGDVLAAADVKVASPAVVAQPARLRVVQVDLLIAASTDLMRGAFVPALDEVLLVLKVAAAVVAWKQQERVQQSM